MTGFPGLLYGVASYGLFLSTFLYSIAFVGNLQLAVASLEPWVPRSIDVGGPAASPLVASLGDVHVEYQGTVRMLLPLPRRDR